MRNSEKGESHAERVGNATRGKVDDEVDALFKLPLGEFTPARNDLAARLKRDGRGDDANLVKGLTKPSVSAWAVNQLYWNHREEFDRLLAAGQRISQAQASGSAGKVDMRESLEARRAALSHLSEFAASLLRDAGHSPTPDTIHRITTTLEAVSAYASLSDGPTPGRLTRDVDPPGFELLASLMAGGGAAKAKEEVRPIPPPPKTSSVANQAGQGASSPAEDTRLARIAAAGVSLQDAKKSLAEATTKARSLEAEQKKADAEVVQAEKELREAEERLKKASAASQVANQRSQNITAEAKEAAKAVEDAERDVEKASKELEALIRESAAG